MELINTFNSIVDVAGLVIGIVLACAFILSPVILCCFADRYTV